MKKGHIFLNAQHRPRIVEHQISRNVPPIDSLRGCYIEVKLTASAAPSKFYKVVKILKMLYLEIPVVVEGNPVECAAVFLGDGLVFFFLVVEL